MAATVNVGEMFGSDASVSEDSTEATRNWQVFKWDLAGGGDFETMAEDDVSAAVSVAIGDPHPSYPDGLCDSVSARLRDGMEVWDVTASYATPDPNEAEEDATDDDFDAFMSQSQVDADDNPIGPEYSGSTQYIEEYSPKDLEGKPFKNSAGDPLATLLPTLVPLAIRRITVNKDSEPDLSQVGTADGYDLLNGISFEQKWHKSGRRYFRVTYEVATHPLRPWVPTIVYDAGYRQVIDGKKLAIKDPDTGQDLNSLSFLDGNGKLLAPTAEPHELEFKVYQEGTIGPFF